MGNLKFETMINGNGLRYATTELCGTTPDLTVPEREHMPRVDDARRFAAKQLTVVD